MDARLRGVAVADLLADALEDENVGVHRHAHREHDARNARQGERRLQHREHRHHHHQVDGQREVGHEPEPPVVERHQDQHQDEADHDGAEALVDVRLAQARAHGALLHDLDGGRERARAQQQREVAGLLGVVEAGDLEPLPELIADRGDVDDLLDDLLPSLSHPVDELRERLVLDVYHAHGAADLVPGAVGKEPCPLAVKRDEHRRRAALLVDAGRRIGDVLAGEHDAALEQNRAAVTLVVELRGPRHAPGGERRLGLVVDHAELQRRGGSEDLLRPGGVLDPGQLDDDPVLALLLDDRLRHPELVDAVAQGGDVLLDREALDLALRVLPELHVEHRVADVLGRFDDQLGHAPAHEIVGLIAVPDVIEPNDQAAVRTHRDRALAELLLPEQGADVARVALLGLPDRAGQIHLHQEVHAAAEIEPQVHRQRAEPGQPLRCRGREVQRHDVLAVERVLDDVPGPELVFSGREPDEEPVGDLRLLRVDAGGLHPGDEPVAQRLVDGRAAHRRHLHRRVLAEQVGEREHDAHEERRRDERVLPRRVLVDHQGWIIGG